MRTAICCLLLAIAAPAFAFRARPVSDVRFDGRLSPNSNYFRPEAQAAASDGTDYLILLREHVKGDPYAQVISQGVPYGPPVLIGHGLGGGVVWTGSLPGDPLGRVTQHDVYGDAPRAEFVFARDVSDSTLQLKAPVAPVILKAVGDATGVTLGWQPQDGVLGFQIELRQSDGSARLIGIAAGSASSTHVPYAGMTGTAIRLRAWNAAGLSTPSADVQLTTRRIRAVAR